MSATQKFFRILFARDGDRAAVPDPTAGDGSISYQNGYGFDYERATGDPLVKYPERNKLNQVLYDLSLGLNQYQTHGFPEYIAAADNGGAAYAYDKNAYVRWTDGLIYVSLVAANTADPTDLTKWAALGAGVGAVTHFPATTAPAGYVKANGTLLSRASYPLLWAFAQASGNLAVSDGAWVSGQFSPGDGATTFRVPDLRGYQVRSWDDGRGVDSARGIGSVQADQLLTHAHTLTDPTHTHANFLSDPGHGHGISDPGHGHGVTVTDPGHGHGVTDPTHNHGVNDPSHSHTITHYSNSDNSGSALAGATAANGSVGATNAAFTGVSLNAAATGVTVNNAGSGITATATVNGSLVSVVGAGSGVTVNNAAQSTGITVNNSTGGGEVRVKNIAQLACIRYL